jgi:hypothetical protein
MRLHVNIASVVVTAGLAIAPALAKSPGVSVFSELTIGPGNGNLLNFDWQINDAGPSATYPHAPGVAGGNPFPQNGGLTVSGWSLLASEMLAGPGHGVSSGNLNWTATSQPGSQFDLQLETLLGPTTPAGVTTDGPMSDFDPTKNYVWPFVAWEGTYTGPTDAPTLTADTLFDTSGFLNSVGPPPGTFSIVYDGNPVVLYGGIPFAGSLDLVYTPVPEPGTLGLVGLGALVVLRRAIRGRRK